MFVVTMPLNLQVIRASEFVRVDATAHLDFASSKEVLRGLARACRKRGIERALIDLRSLPVLPKPHFSPNELAVLVETFRSEGFTAHQRLAILYSSDVFGGIRNFAFFGRMRGLKVQAFTEFERALEWLSEGLHEGQCHQAAVPVSIVQSQPEIKRLSSKRNPRCKDRRVPAARHRNLRKPEPI